MKFRTKPVVKEAVQWKGTKESMTEIFTFAPDLASVENDFLDNSLLIPTLEGSMRANVGDWIIKGLRGEFYPCKPDIFEKTYEPVEE